MTTELSRRQADERIETLWQIGALDVTRHLLRSGATHRESAAAWASLSEYAAEQADRHGSMAVEEGESYADVARALRITRQGARKRYGHLEAVS